MPVVLGVRENIHALVGMWTPVNDLSTTLPPGIITWATEEPRLVAAELRFPLTSFLIKTRRIFAFDECSSRSLSLPPIPGMNSKPYCWTEAGRPATGARLLAK